MCCAAQELLNQKWVLEKGLNPPTYKDKATKQLIMLPADMALIQDRKFKKFVQEYAKDEDKFFADFAAAFSKLLELGVPFPAASAASPKPSA